MDKRVAMSRSITALPHRWLSETCNTNGYRVSSKSAYAQIGKRRYFVLSSEVVVQVLGVD